MLVQWRRLLPFLFHMSPMMKTMTNTKMDVTTTATASTKKGALPNAPCGCDTFVAFPPATPPGTIVFGKNSDRPAGEGQSMTRYAGSQNNNNPKTMVQCTYISIPQAEKTYAVLLSQIDWMWGAEMGANECGVVIGNEAVWTKEPCSGETKYLLGMDLVRLGLERGSTAREALDVITNLLEEHGQGGPCAEDDPSFTYHNSFLIVDKTEAWVLETAGKQWAAERITSGIRNISNCLTIRTNFDLSSKNIVEYARQKGYWRYKDGEEKQQPPFDFTSAFSCDDVGTNEKISDPRFCGGRKLLENQQAGCLDKDSMINILKDHKYGICMHGGFETTSAWVSEIYTDTNSNRAEGDNKNGAEKVARHWLTGKPHPCKSPFVEGTVFVDSESK